MKVAGEYRFHAAPEDVWAALHDPDALAASLPGARRLVPTGADAYDITVDVGVGSVKGTYEGSFALTEQEDGAACTVRATAGGRPGTVTAVARMRLTDDEHMEGAVMVYEADATVTGPLAGVGQRLMGAAARRTTEQFLGALDERIMRPPGAYEEAVSAGLLAESELRIEPSAKMLAASALGGFVLALIGVAVGRWTARR